MYKSIALAGVFFLFFFGMPFQTKAQYTINNIWTEGNVKTKSNIIFRELPYAIGSNIPTDSLSILNTIAQQQLYNTSLFNDVTVSTEFIDSGHIDIRIKVSERWYFFPLPYFRWVDRNFNEWC